MDVILAVVCLGLLTIALLILGLRFRIPGIVCFLLAGILAGPSVLSIVTDQSTIETIGQIGVILLLFVIGLEFSFRQLLESWKMVVFGGLAQVVLTIAVSSSIMYFFRNLHLQEAVFFGFMVSLSSTAIVMKALQERGDVDTVQGRTLLSLLIFQDLAVIPMMLLMPFMMGKEISSASSLPFEAVKVIGILAVLVVSSVWAVPLFLSYVARQRSRELFILSVAAVCFAIAYLTNEAGLSYSLGAFAAGLIIGESEFSIDAASSIIPFRDIFAALFFISIGMLLDPSVILTQTDVVLVLILIILVVKTAVGAFTAAIFGMPLRVAVFVGLALAQIGEFSFVLATNALGSNLIWKGPYQLFLASAIITMAATPLTMNAAPALTALIGRILPSRKQAEGEGAGGNDEKKTLAGHIIVVGFGMTGKSVARAAQIAGIPYAIIDLDPDVVQAERAAGTADEILFGDASQPEVLGHAGIRHARAIVIVISEQNVVPRIVRLARDLNPGIFIIVRTRHASDVGHLLALGADEVVPEEFETSVRIFPRVLGKFGVQDDTTGSLIRKIAGERYRMFTRHPADEPGHDRKTAQHLLRNHLLRKGD